MGETELLTLCHQLRIRTRREPVSRAAEDLEEVGRRVRNEDLFSLATGIERERKVVLCQDTPTSMSVAV